MIEKSIIVRPTALYAMLINLPYLLVAPLLLFGMMLLPAAMLYLAVTGVIIFIYALYNYIYIRKTSYELTKSQLKYHRGVFSLTTDFLEVYRIKDIVLRQPFLSRFIGVMNLTIQSSDKTHTILAIKGIPFSNLADTLRDVVEFSRKNNRVYEVD